MKENKEPFYKRNVGYHVENKQNRNINDISAAFVPLFSYCHKTSVSQSICLNEYPVKCHCLNIRGVSPLASLREG